MPPRSKPVYLQRLPALLTVLGSCVMSVAAMAAPAAEKTAAAGSVSPPAAAMRVLKANCLSCHNEEKRKGGLSLHSREALMSGGENGAAVVDGKPEESALIQSLAAEADPHMPPKKQLSPQHIALLRDWVRDGFAWDAAALAGPVSAPRAVTLAALPSSYQPVMAMALSPDGSRLAASCGNEVLLFGTALDGSGKLAFLAKAHAHPDAVQSMAWIPDGKTLVTGAFRRAVIWNTDKDTLIPQREISSGLTDRISAILTIAPQPRQSPPSGQEATPAPATEATDTKPVPAAVPSAAATETALASSSAPNVLVALADGLTAEVGIVRILDTESGQILRSWTAHSDTIYAMALSHDGKRLATAGGDKLVKLWNPETGAETARLEAHTTQVLSVAFNPDDTQLITGGADRELKVWDAATRGNLITLPVKDSAFNALQWTTAGPAVLAAMDDGGLMKYTDFKVHTGAQSSESGKESRLGKTDSSLCALAVSADGTRIFAGSHDGHIFSWDKDGKLMETKDVTDLVDVADAKPAASPQPDAATNPLTTVTVVNPVSAVPSVSTTPPAPGESAGISSILLEPAALTVEAGRPASFLVTARRVDGFETDVTGSATITVSDSGKLAAEGPGVIRARSAGTATLTVRLGEHHAELPIQITAPPADVPVSFVRDVLPVLGKAGCNAGPCHAKADGQNGFRLTVFSFDPKADYHNITEGARGRRIFPSDPAESLLLLKATQTLPHEGGARFDSDSDAFRTLTAWISGGLTYQNSGEPAMTSLTVLPRERRYPKGASQRLVVQAGYSDGSVRDVTALAKFESNDKQIATVSEDGKIRVDHLSGQAVVVARFMGLVGDSKVLVPAERTLPEEQYQSLPVSNFIDTLAWQRLRHLGLFPSEPCTDAEFLRRASLDTLGQLPSADEARAFLADTDPDKRSKAIDRLLANPAWADLWATKWADLLRPNPDRVGVKGVYLLDQWLRETFRENRPWDQFVRSILLTQGNTHRYGPAVIYRDRREPADLTTMFSQLFLGTRLDCAKCHHHPNEKWSQEDFYRMAAFFAPLKQKGGGISAPISGGNETFFVSANGGGVMKHPVTGEVLKPQPPDGPPAAVAEGSDPRQALADWLLDPANPFFAKAMANRIWAQFFGKGIVDPVDDFRLSNPPSNPALLDALAAEFIRLKYDAKALARVILQSRVYQLSGTPNETNTADTRNFSRSWRRRMAAEVMADAVADVTQVPTKYPGLPVGSRAMSSWTYKIDSRTMDAFGRPNSSSDCPCERNLAPAIGQALHLMNSEVLQSKLASTQPQSRVQRLAANGGLPAEAVIELYLAAYSRLPEPDELAAATAGFPADPADTAGRHQALEDVLWSLLNSAEFVFNH